MKEYSKAQANGETVDLQANDGVGVKTEAISVDTTLTAADSGKTYILDAVGEVITLPSVTDGLKYKFVLNATTATTNWTIVSATNVIQGSALVAGAVVAAANENTISVVAAKGIAGDFVEISSDGTNWYAFGVAVTTGAITFTAP